jgi:hypothetical protein
MILTINENKLNSEQQDAKVLVEDKNIALIGCPNPSVNIELVPSSGVDYYTYCPAPCNSGPNNRHWGQRHSINGITEIAKKWRQFSRLRLGIGDISHKCGGPFQPEHTTGHQNGNEVDVRPIRKDHKEGPVRWNIPGTQTIHPDYDGYGSRELVRKIRENSHYKKIYFNDKNLISMGWVEPLSGHDDHLHIVFQP